MYEQCGTPAYIAPEILRNKGYTQSVDLWSAGVVLFAMLYGSVPFKGQSMEELHDLILNGRYVLKEDISTDAINLLRGLLEIDPRKRLSIKQIYQHPWLKTLDEKLKLFTPEECELINKEYTYNHPSRCVRRQQCEDQPVDGFTEQFIES
jgi:serine/threonine protein kinase